MCYAYLGRGELLLITSSRLPILDPLQNVFSISLEPPPRQVQGTTVRSDTFLSSYKILGDRLETH